MHESPLRAVSKPLLNCQIRNEHDSHHMRSWHMPSSFALVVPITSHVQVPQRLRPRKPPSKLSSPLVEPCLAPCPARSHPALHFERVVSGFRDPSNHNPVPSITVPSLREYTRASFKLSMFCAADTRSEHVRVNYELLHSLCRVSHAISLNAL